jgi:hypothetical protein
MANAKKAQDRIWAFHDGPLVGYFVGQSPGEGAYVAEFIRADLVNTPSPDAIMLAALADHIESMSQEAFLEWALAVDKALETHSPAKCAEAIRSLAELKGEGRG